MLYMLLIWPWLVPMGLHMADMAKFNDLVSGGQTLVCVGMLLFAV